MKAFRIPRAPTAFSTSPTKGRKRPRVHDGAHLAFVRSLPCLITGMTRGVEAAHIRYADPRFGKRETGVGEKASDRWTVPLHVEMHRLGKDAQHAGNERAFWRRHGIDPVRVAAALYANSGDYEVCESIIREARGAK